MFVSYKWLNELVDVSHVTPQALADKMSLTGIEVEGISYPSDGLKKVVVGHVESCVAHPDSDHLSICQVDVGQEELTQIVCGAPNIKAGINVIVALPSARIAGNVKIKKGKMRGQISNGMICSLQEIGYEESVVPKEYAEGIYYLPEEAVPGQEVFPYLEMDDAIIELAITPNRADAMSMRGVAFETGAIYREKPVFKKKELIETSSKASDKIKVHVNEEKDAPSYQIRLIENVKIKASPRWLQNRLMNIGIRPINNVVDVTNYILMYYGQPLHAFDYDRLSNQEIMVRRAQKAEELVTLDGETRALNEENIVITDGQQPVALAGVMGGLDSEITESTTTVALEAALFDPAAVRRTSQEFNLHSESSARFEKGINVETIDEACEQACALIAELTGGNVLQGAVKAAEVQAQDTEVKVTLQRLNDYLGTNLTVAEVNDIFTALGFGYHEHEGSYTVVIPPRRWDITIEADIVEEVARIYGYNNLPSTLPSGETVAGTLTHDQLKTRKVRTLLEAAGLSEAISYALTSEQKSQQFTTASSKLTRLDWPMSAERTVLRLNLVSGLLDDVAYNVARRNEQVALYEVGRVFYQVDDPKADLPQEINHVAFVLSGEWTTQDWQSKGDPVDFYQAKGILEELFAELNLADQVTYEKTTDRTEMHPGRCAEVFLNKQSVGFVGQVHPTITKQYEVPETYAAELDLDTILRTNSEFTYVPVTKYPKVTRDIALVIEENIANQTIVQTIEEEAGKFLQEVSLFDVYQGENIETGYKSMAYRLTFVNQEATLTDEQINKAMEKVEKALTEKLTAAIR
ncbi:phenylalanine--tRNA ligase subunit beta [Tetragenococcus koreensis]|uniref:Phenylalanine--tRNA ligase beta subunit n=1 Tax=Tetragenococcus koreensis TaxID=290335 RepID=A0AAN4RIN2_9ENTE|nr:phenylalanine--tRNA ligase subunit beta [Tetragenococcus koreensis]AYW44951.1 phenylalanine--tRNA ligase subunit beta [Tetragenococcus koreensis]MCF1585522.1 phenylalanine--tRNA ligase subunit beta [Tetragenococcus koreensis]MCF1619228.1 phenylalanine--tRNA ligase subunit beta [Tetragenococcus koreensis]MCF1629788.1 phenylalanine--tRNA ligase subunit beta [Tetragenococcus koreensis]MCF1642669.1 phenylalanine--tRNA ligase subunit beta [Tetragenococcus koreensis]